METDFIHFVRKCHQCQIHGDLIRVPPNELNMMGSPWPFPAWVMDAIGSIEPAVSNRHRFILMNGEVEAANKNIKIILHKMIDNYKYWQENFPFSLLGYRTIIRTSTGATPYVLVYGTEAVLPMKVEIPSLTIIQETELSDVKWTQSRYEQLMLIDKKRMNARIFPHQDEAKGKFAPNWEGPYIVHQVLTGGASILAEMDRKIWPKATNSDAVKKYYV
ncbi:uncharacterized protein LOC129883463 [Solanum dulcamara]|uniref:uncharacterized protein LOC129883463 n=1 Tax=Solanum dulcamara TaxID=45834 RepID=UPI0024855054|nr:uncharacterized protein LOC129883463 [Solanum dulcamara]